MACLGCQVSRLQSQAQTCYYINSIRLDVVVVVNLCPADSCCAIPMQVAQPLVAHDDIVKVTVTQGPVITEITQTWTSWASLTTRLVAGSGLLHQEWTVGPIPVDDDVGKEVIVRTSTDLQNGKGLGTLHVQLGVHVWVMHQHPRSLTHTTHPWRLLTDLAIDLGCINCITDLICS